MVSVSVSHRLNVPNRARLITERETGHALFDPENVKVDCVEVVEGPAGDSHAESSGVESAKVTRSARLMFVRLESER